MIFARKDFVVAFSGVGIYADAATFRLPDGLFGVKISIRVRDTPSIIQISETTPPTFEAPENTEQVIEKGFQSLVYVTPITAFRFRSQGPGTARINFTVYG